MFVNLEYLLTDRMREHYKTVCAILKPAILLGKFPQFPQLLPTNEAGFRAKLLEDLLGDPIGEEG